MVLFFIHLASRLGAPIDTENDQWMDPRYATDDLCVPEHGNAYITGPIKLINAMASRTYRKGCRMITLVKVWEGLRLLSSLLVSRIRYPSRS